MSADIELEQVEPHRRAGVALDHIARSRNKWAHENRRPRALTARDALLALQCEAAIVWVIGVMLRDGQHVSELDWHQFGIALRRIDQIADEATR